MIATAATAAVSPLEHQGGVAAAAAVTSSCSSKSSKWDRVIDVSISVSIPVSSIR